MKKYIPLLFLIIASIGYSQTNTADTEIDFDLKGTSKLLFANETKDTVHLKVNNWTFISAKLEEIDTILLPRQSINLSVTPYAKNYINLYVNKKNIRLLAEPYTESKIIISKDKEESVRFRGKHEKINEFINQRGVQSDFMPRIRWYQGGGSVSELVDAFDSITAVQQKDLRENDLLPNWYKNYEKTRLDYFNAEIKLTALHYRKLAKQNNDTVPEDYFRRAIDGLSLDKKEMIGSSTYNSFINWYLIYATDPMVENDIPKTKDEWIAWVNNRIAMAKKHLKNPLVRDIYLSYHLNGLIDRKRHLMDKKWIGLIENPELRKLVYQQFHEAPVLPRGAIMPHFNLEDIDSVNFDSNTLKGKVVLINFWATWCKPCYQQFESENKLVETFRDQPVAIINICIRSDKEKWKEVVKKYNLTPINLYANQKWSYFLNEKYVITAVPQSVLIDKKGKIHENKCPKPSEGLEDVIRELLEK